MPQEQDPDAYNGFNFAAGDPLPDPLPRVTAPTGAPTRAFKVGAVVINCSDADDVICSTVSIFSQLCRRSRYKAVAISPEAQYLSAFPHRGRLLSVFEPGPRISLS
jgi:hypothetical protein